MNTLTATQPVKAGMHIPFVREMAETTYNMWKFGWD